MTATKGSPSGGLHIEADLTVGLTESTIQVQSAADTLYIDARSFDALTELRAAADSEALAWLRKLGVSASLDIETPVVVRVRGVPVGRYHSGKPAGRLATALGISPFKLSLRGVLRAAGRRLRPT